MDLCAIDLYILIHMRQNLPKAKLSQKQKQMQKQLQIVDIEDIPQLNVFQHGGSKKFDEALLNLTEQYHPTTILCRDEEKKEIENFIKEGIRANGNSETLYISGVPGIGKTLLVKDVLFSFKRDLKKKNDKNTPKIMYINAMNLKKPKDIFKKILEQLSHRSKGSLNAMYLLNDFFSKGFSTFQRNIEVFSPKILVIDEIDYLWTKDEQVIYSILQWTQAKNSRLILIAISNTIDFPETLKGKVSSRMGNRRIVFKPYVSKQIQTILKERIKKQDVFEEQAVEYMCKKIAKCSSDIRKCLLVLREAITTHVSQFQVGQKVQGKVSLQILSRVYEESFNDNTFVRNFQKFHNTLKIILFVLAKYFRLENVAITYTELQKKCNALLKSKLNYRPLLIDLKTFGYIDLKYAVTRSDKRINKNIQIYKQYQEEHLTLMLDVDNILYAASKDQNNHFIIQD